MSVSRLALGFTSKHSLAIGINMKNQAAQQTVLMATPYASATTERTATLDTTLFGSCDFLTIHVPLGIEANTNSTNVILTVAHGDTTSTFSTISTTVIDNTAAVCAVVHNNWLSRGRYAKVTVTPDTTTNGAVLIGGIVATINPEIRGMTASTTSQVVSNA